ncbi:phage portal protein [Streptomyces sp. WZ-12]|uniref:phage portal protein n=1 Tax=Streptomyces sp. WZ-12 TaxID=3030210 RepID=UPI002381522C|nr:phage portal protein [Streptomyces sp. WZ-12]
MGYEIETPGAAFGVPDTPIQWLQYLLAKYEGNLDRIKRFAEYYEGDHQRMMFAQAKFSNAFGEAFSSWSDNFCGLIVDSVNERMKIEGFRMADTPEADNAAQKIWERNFLDADSNAAHLDAMIQGASYGVVWWGEDGGPAITIESAENMAVQYMPGSRRELVAAAKFLTDDWGRQYATLWMADAVYEFETYDGDWVGSSEGIPNPLGAIPVVPINNRSRLTGDPLSDLDSIIPLQDAINKTVADALVASEYAAWPQRYVTGLEIQEDADGNPIEPFRVAVDKLLQAEDPGASFGQFEAADLGNYSTLVTMLVQHLASASRIPFHYFLQGAVIPSGDAITSAEAGLISKTRERMLHFGEAWERIMLLAFRVMGQDLEPGAIEVLWRDPEHRTEAQHIDSLVKKLSLGVPRQQLWEDAGYSPSQISRFTSMLEQQEKMQEQFPSINPQPAKAAPTAEEEADKAPRGNSENAAREKAGV